MVQIVRHSVLLALLASESLALDNGLGITPQMGWNSWNKFRCDISEDLIKQTADQLVSQGFVELGYTYLNLDDCWMQQHRTPDGHIQVSPAFPSGMKALGDYIHSKGLKFGLYSSAGTNTCEGRAGSLWYEEMDANDYASWGVDYLKYDNCYNDNVPALIRFPRMRDALNATGRQIFFSLCNGGRDDVPDWGKSIGNSFRTTSDISDTWGSIEFNFRENVNLASKSGPGGWNDPDMLEVGNGGLTLEEEKTHFALWAISKAPLIIGCDLTIASQDSLKILMNKDLIEINQDPNSPQATCINGCDSNSLISSTSSVYLTKTGFGDIVFALVNWSELQLNNTKVSLEDLGINQSQQVDIRDLTEQKDLGTFAGKELEQKLTFKSILSHGSKVYKLTFVQTLI